MEFYGNDVLIDKILSNVRVIDGCWVWQKGRFSNGYGSIGISSPGTELRLEWKTFLTHRLSFLVFTGDIPKGLFVCHHCDNRPCVCPSHLFIGTAKDNMIDASRKGRTYVPESSEKSKLSETDVIGIRHRFASGEDRRQIASDYCVAMSTISRIATGIRWRDSCGQISMPRKCSGENCKQSKLTYGDVAELRHRYASGERLGTIASDYGISESTVSHAALGRSWKSAGGPISKPRITK